MSRGDQLLFHRVEVDGRIVDVRVANGRIDAVDRELAPTSGTEVIDGRGGALIPGLHDHHIHLFATAAAAHSVAVGPPDVRDPAALARALRAGDRSLADGRWLRAVGYHESVAGDLDRDGLDEIVRDRPLRLQHRSGARWTLNSTGVDVLGLATSDHAGIERDHSGRPTGRLHRSDRWLRDLLPHDEIPDLGALGSRLARYGVTGLTDTTASERMADVESIADAVETGLLPQRVRVTGGPGLSGATFPPGVERGPVKFVLDDEALPVLDDLAVQISEAHAHRRPAALHCVTRTSLVFALAAWDMAGSRPGDRLEHGAVVPPELAEPLVRHAITVVTQPGFIAERGDDYLRDVDPADLPDLYRCRSLTDAGIRVAGSTDAPYTSLNPWDAMLAAVTRRAPSGAIVGAREKVTPARALGLFLGDLQDPGGPARRIRPGELADLCLLDEPLAAVGASLSDQHVVATACAGHLVYRA